MPPTSAHPAPRHSWITRLRVAGGYLDGLDMAFAPGGNVACGAPGSGKSTALALLRYVLCLPVPPRKRDEFDALIEANLGAGRAYVTTCTAHGVEYELSRAGAEDEPRVESKGESSAKAILAGVPVRFAGHGELELMATDGLARLDLLTSFVKSDVDRIGAELAKVRQELDEGAGSLFLLERQLADLAKKPAALAAERARLEELKKAAGGDTADLDRANRELALRDRGRATLAAADREIAWLRGEAGIFAATARRRLGQALDPEAERGPDAALVAEVAREITRLSGELEAFATRTAAQCDAARTLASKHARTLAALHAPADDAYRALLARHESDSARAGERLKLEKSVAELEKARDAHAASAHEHARKVAQRDALRARSRALVAELLETLDRAAREVTLALEDRVRVVVAAEAERTAYRALLGDLLKGKRFESDKLDAIVAAFSPEDLCALVLRGDVATLADKLGKATALRLASILAESPRVYELETVDVPHVPVVSLVVGGEAKPSETLSSGQRKLAFFSILLLQRGILVIDQPEDDVSNRYLAGPLCEMFASVQDEMQFIFVTHDGNIPILGRAQRVFELDSDGKRGWLSSQGTPSEVRGPMEDNFEGGRGAFVARKDFYGVR